MDNDGTYVAATADSLREIDPRIGNVVVKATQTSYCLETASGSYHWNGPGGVVSPGSC